MPRPNVLFVMTDHTNAAAAAAGGPCLTPCLDALAADGLRFGRAYTPNAICSPARASLMTGTYPSTHGVWDCTHTQRPEWVDVRGGLTHWAERLAEAGYMNGYFGKWHVEQSGRLGDFGWHEHDTGCGGVRVECEPGTESIVKTEGYRDCLLAAVGRQDTPEHHPAFDGGIEFIRKAADGDAPFCCFISTLEPHDPYVPPPRFWDMYDPAAAPLPESLRDDCADKPEVVRRMAQVWRGLTDDDWRRVRTAYWAVVSFLDSEVGRVIEALRQAGVYEDTVIVFTSDHGDMLGAHGLATKGVGTPYEEVHNTPLIVRVPGLRSGEDVEHRASLVDLGPTLLDLCGARPLGPCQGRSLRPVLEGTSDPADWQDAYAEFFGQRFVYTQRITWHGDWKYVFSPGGVDELYNLRDDPGERRNLADNPAHRDALVDMTRRMWRKMAEIGDESLFGTHYATLRTAPVGPGSVRGD